MVSLEHLTAGVPTQWTTDHHRPGGGVCERKEVDDGDVQGRTGAEGCEKMALWEWEACPTPSACQWGVGGGWLRTKEAFVEVQ